MKRFLSIVALLAAFAVTSCDNPFAFEYNVKITGDADGDFTLTFPDGQLGLDGTAGINFKYGNADSLNAVSIDQALQLSEKFSEVAEAAYVDVDEQFQAYAAEGTYYVLIDGFVREKKTGIVIRIRKELTNR